MHPDAPDTGPYSSWQLLLLQKAPLGTGAALRFYLSLQEHLLLRLLDVAMGMDYLHKLGILHTDLKPSNVLLKTAAKQANDPTGCTCKVSTRARPIRDSHPHMVSALHHVRQHAKMPTLQVFGVCSVRGLMSYLCRLISLDAPAAGGLWTLTSHGDECHTHLHQHNWDHCLPA